MNPTRGRALGHLRVVDLSVGVATSLAARMFGDLGADVIKIETAGGDARASLRDGALSDDTHFAAAVGEYIDANKRTLIVQRGNRTRSILDAVRGADLLIEDLGPGELESEGIDLQILKRANPSLAVVRFSPFGQAGPDAGRPATGLTLQARSGWVRSRDGSPPVQVGGRFHEYVAASYLSTIAFTAIMAVRRSGAAVEADVAMLDCIQSTQTFPTLTLPILARLRRDRGATGTLLGVKPCRDGWVGVNILTTAQWLDFCELAGLSAYAQRREELRQPGPERDAFENAAANWTSTQLVEDLVADCQARRLPVVPVYTGRSITQSRHWDQRPFFVEAKTAQRTFVRPSFPWRFSALETSTEPSRTMQSADAAFPSPEEARASCQRADGALPLAGLRVLDLGTYWAGAGCGCYLGAMGADVIKVESPKRPDGWRFNLVSPELGPQWYEAGRYRGVNLNKRGLTLDLTTEAGARALERLIADADVLLENYSARVLDGLGFGWERVQELNPRIVLARIPGFGLEGPWRDYVGFGPSFAHVSGLTAVTGFEDGTPLEPGGQLDPVVAMAGSFAILAALEYREKTGLGQLVEAPQIEVGAAMVPEPVIAASLGIEVERIGNRSHQFVPQGVYQANTGRWVAVSVRTDDEWARFADAVGVPDSLRNATSVERRAREDDIDELIQEWMAALSHDEADARLRTLGVPTSVVAESSEFADDPQLRSRAFFEELDHPVAGVDLYPGWPVVWNPRRAAHRLPAPLMGEHSREILMDAGYRPSEVDDLERGGVVGYSPAGASV